MLRAAKPTASEMDRILTPGGKLSSQCEGYLNHLLSEFVLGYPVQGPQTEWMIRGQELEDRAIEAYEFQAEVETDRVGFVTSADGLVGCSPDRLVGTNRLLEIKVPSPAIHVGYMRTGSIEAKYKVQCQAQLWITERERVDIVSFHPEMPAVIIPVRRDEVFIENLSMAVMSFVEILEAAKIDIERRYGPFVRRAPPAEPDKQFDMTEADVDMIWDHLQARKGA